MRKRSILYGVIAALVLTVLIGLGSQGFHWFDATLIGYAVGTIFAVAAVTYKYTFWIDRPPTGRYWRRSWQMFLSFANFRRYTSLVPRAIITDIFTQGFIRKRGRYRWIMHQCLFWGVIGSCAITFPLTFGWLRFTQTQAGDYYLWLIGLPTFTFPPGSIFGFLIFHALDFTALLLLVGLVLALHRRFHDLAVVTVQRFNFDLVPLALLLAIVLTGLALTADSAWLGGAYYWYISLTHEVVVVLWLISLPFGKFFHLIERPATVGIKLYTQITQEEAMHPCVRCGTEFATARFIGDLKKTLADVGENYTLPATVTLAQGQDGAQSSSLWWQDLCPTCKRVMRAQAIFATTGNEGNRFL